MVVVVVIVVVTLFGGFFLNTVFFYISDSRKRSLCARLPLSHHITLTQSHIGKTRTLLHM